MVIYEKREKVISYKNMKTIKNETKLQREAGTDKVFSWLTSEQRKRCDILYSICDILYSMDLPNRLITIMNSFCSDVCFNSLVFKMG